MSEEASISTFDVGTQQVIEVPVPSHNPASEGTQQPAAPAPAQKPPVPSGAPGDTSIDDGGNQDQPPRGKNWASRKIDELTRERETERREKQELMQTLRQLTEQQRQPQQKQRPAPPVSPEHANDPGYDPQDPEPSRDSFDDYDRYARAVARWETRMEIRGTNVRNAHAQHQNEVRQTVMRETAAIATHYNQTAQAWDAQHPEFADKVESLRGISAEANPTMVRAIFTSQNPPAVLDALASAPQVAHRITQLPPEQQIRAVAFIESRLASQQAQVSNAPRVGRPVGSTNASSRTAYRDDFTPEQHRAWKKASGIN